MSDRPRKRCTASNSASRAQAEPSRTVLWAPMVLALAGAYLTGNGVTKDPARARDLFAAACDRGLATSCSNLGYMYQSGDGVAQDRPKALAYLKQSCELGYDNACRWLSEQRISR